jgi:hypothetical protein
VTGMTVAQRARVKPGTTSYAAKAGRGQSEIYGALGGPGPSRRQTIDFTAEERWT